MEGQCGVYRPMRVAIVQNNPDFGKPEGNARVLSALMRRGREESLRASGEAPLLFVLPELCCSGYNFTDRAEALSLAEASSGGPSLDILADCARELDAALAFGFPERSGGSLFNSQLLLLPDGSRELYRKTHLFAREKELFEPGDTGFIVREFRGLKVGLAVCFDWFFPEAFRSLALLGADLIAHSANLVLPWCQRAGFVRALENGVYLATANRWGAEDRGGTALSYLGWSIAHGPRGEVLAELPAEGDGCASFVVEPERARDKALNAWNDLLGDRRPESYR